MKVVVNSWKVWPAAIFLTQRQSCTSCRSCHAVQTRLFLWFSSFWTLQVPSATLSATRPDFKRTWPGNRQMHTRTRWPWWAFFIFQECLYVCRLCRSAFIELLCFFWDASRLKHFHSWLHSRRSCRDSFLIHVDSFDLAHLTPLTLTKVYESLMISSNDEIKDGESGWKLGVDQLTLAEVEVLGFLAAFDLSTLCLSLRICGQVLTCSHVAPFGLKGMRV